MKPKVRLHIFLARRALVGVILRSGPSKWTEMIRWDLQRGTFERGQWFHGSIYPERCDLSPMGDKFIYFVGQWKARNEADGYAATWTAVCEPPYFTAQTLWPKGDTWGGGGSFIDNDTVLVGTGATHPNHPAGRLRIHTGRCLDADEKRERDGWFRGDGKLWRKPNPIAKLVLTTPHRTYEQRTKLMPYSLVHPTSGEVKFQFEAHWADWDAHGRLISAHGGQLRRIALAGHRITDWSLLADFTDDKFQPVPPLTPKSNRRP